MAKKKAQSVRRTKPKTAYELCERVCNAIQEHPYAYYQNSWVIRGKRNVLRRMTPSADTSGVCGAAYCRAGWIVALADGFSAVPRLVKQTSSSFWDRPVADRANELLGVQAAETNTLFAAMWPESKPGSRGYVREGVRGLRAFMKTHAKHLKSRLLEGV